jgi:site-specific recombinase XerD
MATKPEEEYTRMRNRIDKAEEKGDISSEEAEYIREWLDAKDKDNISTPDPDNNQLEKQSLNSYGDNVRLVAKRLDISLLEADTNKINEYMDTLMDNLSKSTVQLYQCSLVSFYRYHTDLDVDPEKVVILKDEPTKVDEQDIFNRSDIESMRNVIPNDRDRAIFELALNTGQRVRALQSLRVKDVKPQEGVFYLNNDVKGLKGADKQSRKRPLLGARKACLDWLEKHPTSDKPESAFITHLPKYEKRYGDKFGEALSGQHINRRLKMIGEEAEINKPTHVHNFRHSFVTIAKRDYDLDDSTIKFIIGHAKDSSVMETTYSHLTADDHISKAEVGAGIKEKEESSTLTPEICPTCYNNLEPGDKACSVCGEIFTPDAQAAKNKMSNDVYESKGEAEGEEESALDQMKDLLNENPELINELTDDQ